MADQTGSAATAAWHSVVAHRAELIRNPSKSRDLEQRLAAVEEHLLDLAAPDLEGVVLKLELLWSASLHGEDDESRHKLAILADLRHTAA